MSNQVQCPNCGGYKVTSETKPILEEIPAPRLLDTIVRVAFFILGLVFLGTSLYSILFVDMWFLIFPVVVFGGVLGVVLLFGSFKGTTSIEKKKGEYYIFYCLLCGYSWEWSKGQSWSEVTVKPDLIAKGAQRLEEEAAAAEEEEQKRKERDFIMLSQRYGKK